jgi:hypothetical protein
MSASDIGEEAFQYAHEQMCKKYGHVWDDDRKLCTFSEEQCTAAPIWDGGACRGRTELPTGAVDSKGVPFSHFPYDCAHPTSPVKITNPWKAPVNGPQKNEPFTISYKEWRNVKTTDASGKPVTVGRCVMGNTGLRQFCELPNSRLSDGKPMKGLYGTPHNEPNTSVWKNDEMPPWQYFPNHGVCQPTKNYCERMGTSWLTETITAPDGTVLQTGNCHVDEAQEIFQHIFGTAFTRDFIRTFDNRLKTFSDLNDKWGIMNNLQSGNIGKELLGTTELLVAGLAESGAFVEAFFESLAASFSFSVLGFFDLGKELAEVALKLAEFGAKEAAKLAAEGYKLAAKEALKLYKSKYVQDVGRAVKHAEQQAAKYAKEFGQAAANEIVSGAKDAYAAAQKAAAAVDDGIEDALAAMGPVGAALNDAGAEAEKLFSDAGKAARAAFDATQKLLGPAFIDAQKELGKWGRAAGAGVKEAVDDVSGVASEAWDSVKDEASKLAKSAIHGIEDVGKSVGHFFHHLFGGATLGAVDMTGGVLADPRHFDIIAMFRKDFGGRNVHLYAVKYRDSAAVFGFKGYALTLCALEVLQAGHSDLVAKVIGPAGPVLVINVAQAIVNALAAKKTSFAPSRAAVWLWRQGNWRIAADFASRLPQTDTTYKISKERALSNYKSAMSRTPIELMKRSLFHKMLHGGLPCNGKCLDRLSPKDYAKLMAVPHGRIRGGAAKYRSPDFKAKLRAKLRAKLHTF